MGTTRPPLHITPTYVSSALSPGQVLNELGARAMQLSLTRAFQSRNSLTGFSHRESSSDLATLFKAPLLPPVTQALECHV